MTDDEERDQVYTEGQKQAYRSVLAACLKEMGDEGNAERWRVERADVVAALRQVCREFGDNEWPDELQLADVLEKHLARHLRERPC